MVIGLTSGRSSMGHCFCDDATGIWTISPNGAGLDARPDDAHAFVVRDLDFIGAIELAYDRSTDDAAWLADLAAFVGPAFGPGLSATTAFFFDLDPRVGAAPRLGAFGSESDGPNLRARYEKLHAGAPVALQRKAYECDIFTLLSRVVGKESTKQSLRASGMPGDDSLGLRVNVTPNRGAIITTMVSDGYRIRNRTLWTRFAAHAGAALRLRQEQAPPSVDTAAAVLSPNGKLEHGQAETIAARDALGAAARSIDRARGKLRRLDPEAAIAHWQAMVRGEWSLVDWLDHDGKRFLIAQDNRIPADPPAELTERELQIVACAAMGHSNKLIAYDLGLAPGTIAVVLARAARKLGVTSRPALIRAYRDRLAGTGSSRPPGASA